MQLIVSFFILFCSFLLFECVLYFFFCANFSGGDTTNAVDFLHRQQTRPPSALASVVTPSSVVMTQEIGGAAVMRPAPIPSTGLSVSCLMIY